MTKKDFKTGIDLFVSAPEQEQPAPEPVKADLPREQRETDTTKAQKKGTGTKGQNHKEITRAKKETKSKRLNLLIQPSVIEDLNKIATMQKDSVNNLINSALIEYRDAHKNLIEKYNKVFEG